MDLDENNLDELDNTDALLDTSLFEEDEIAADDDEIAPILAVVDEDEILEEEEEILDELDALALEEDEEGFDLYNDDEDF
jgi:hypothetical protein